MQNQQDSPVVKLLGKRWWIPAGARIEGPKLDPEGLKAEVGSRPPTKYKLCRVVPDLLLEVVDLKQEVPDLRSGGIPLNLTPALNPYSPCAGVTTL